MRKSISFSEFCDAFRDMDRNDNFSYKGKRALYDWLEEVNEGNYELDVIALCYEYYEQDLDGIIADYQIDVSEAEEDDAKIDIVEEYLRENTYLIARIGTDFLYNAF